ncbi:MAG: PQQ-binding-like beta-propeller repeat protein, partial [Dehalococcoidia bacterium]
AEQTASGEPGNAPAGTEPSGPTGQAAEPPAPFSDLSTGGVAPPGDLLSQTQQLAADVIGQGNVSTLQGYQGSRILHWAGRNFNCMGDRLICSSARSGDVLWSHHLEGDLEKLGGHLAAPPIAAGAELVMATLSGHVLRIAPADGRVIETYATGSPLRFSPVVDEGWIYVGTQDGRVVVINTGDRSLTGWPTWGGNAARTAAR